MNLLSFLPIIWLAVILAAIFTEAAIPRLTAIWCAPAAAAALICGMTGLAPSGQAAVFAVSTVSLIVISRIVSGFTKRRHRSPRIGGKI